MISLCMDTSNQLLVLALIDDKKTIASKQIGCLKKQSEEIFPCLLKLFEDSSMNVQSIQSICISIGPGSYTGIRIAMTIAKVICSLNPSVTLYTLDTLQLYAGTVENVSVALDARSQRVYFANFSKGERLLESQIIEVEHLEKYILKNIISDIESIATIALSEVDIAQNFFDLKSYWQHVSDVDKLAPLYLKQTQDYLQ